MKYTTINIQGNLLSEDILQKVESGEAQGQQVTDFGFEPGTNLRSEMEYAWSRIKLDWKHFSEKSQNLPDSDPYGTNLSRRWMVQFFVTLGFELSYQRKNLIGANQQGYNISHTATNLDDLPVHIVGFTEPGKPDKNTLDIKTSGGTSRLSPHATVQEYLNVTEHLFGIATNGLYLRLIRDSGRLIKLTYVEFDLKRMLDEDKYSEFTLLYRLLHASRFPQSKTQAEQCLLEKYYQDSIESGNRIRDGLSLAVKESLLALGNGFLQHELNSALRTKIQNGQLSPKDYFRELMRVVYRLLFLMVAEERDLVYNPEDKNQDTLRFKKIYTLYYSTARLRKLSASRYLYESQYSDLWLGLLQTFRLFESGGNGEKLGISPLNGELFDSRAIINLQECHISNKLLLECIRNMNEFEDANRNRVTINYRALDVEELGSVYEGLLDLHPVVEHIDSPNPEHIRFTFHEGTERKTTGSYYTRPELVSELIKTTLIPVIDQRLRSFAGDREKQADALLNIKVCDPAAGSGHMLLAAARTIAWYLARVKSGEENPAPGLYRKCLREVIQHCIYGVDLNPDAVELCKLALWIEGHNSGSPLSFLNHRILNGNSLVGVTDLSVLQKGIPENAYNPVTGCNRKIFLWYKKRARNENIGNYELNFFKNISDQLITETKLFASEYRELENLPENSVEQTLEKARRFSKLRSNTQWLKDWTACNIWTAAFFYMYTHVDDPAAPTPEKLKNYLKTPTGVDGRVVGKANALSIDHKFFHWPLEFPDVFEQGGFDVILSNPPWEIIELKEREFFANKNSEIADAENKAARTKLIDRLKTENPALYNEYEKANHYYDAVRKFLRESGRNPLTSKGRINMYAVFAETFFNLINKKGRAGIIVPTGIATDEGNKDFFVKLIESNRLVSLYDFENREAIFQSVHRSYKFCLLTLAGSDIGQQMPRFGFFLTRTEHLQDDRRIFTLCREDFLRLNPNTKTCPVFRTRVDAELTKKIYCKVPVLINESARKNPWRVSFRQGLFNMSSDSDLFSTRQKLEAEGFCLWGNTMKRGNEVWLPLYEAKMIWHYDHRYGTYAGVDSRTSTQTPTPEQYQDPCYQILPWYWVEESKVKEITQDKWFIGFRNITNSTNERTTIISLIPFSAVGNSMPLIFLKESSICKYVFTSILTSLIFDYCTRQKLGGVNMNFGYIQQLPVLTPIQLKYSVRQILCKTLELSYTSWDIKAFADEVWKEAGESEEVNVKSEKSKVKSERYGELSALQAAIVQQWEENRAVTGGHAWAPPVWHEDHGRSPDEVDGCPLPPFKWDEERRAVLKAELDALYAKLYGLSTEELRYILDPQDVYGPDFPGETFRVLKEKEIRQFGEYRTKRLVLEAWERLHQEGQH